MKSLFIPHQYELSAHVKVFVCKRCGHIFDVHKYNLTGQIDSYVILCLMESACELKYEQVKELLEYMAVKEIHET